jgi:hypothetical protein
MSFIAMNTNNPLGQRPFRQMGHLAGDFDFPGAPLPRRTPPEMLSGNAAKEGTLPGGLHPPATVERLASAWDSPESVMMLGDAAVTSTQTVVATADTTPVVTTAVASGQPQSWFSQQTLIPGIDNLAAVAGFLALAAIIGKKL